MNFTNFEQSNAENTPTLGVFIADTLFYNLAENAIQHAKKIVNPKDIIIFTDNTMLGAGHQQIQIGKISNIEHYNKLVLEEFPKYTSSDYYIIIQYDGFPLNSNMFSDDFFEYDYIGASWPQFDTHNVGNGGFSWRSRRLINIVSELAHLRPANEAEDVFICRTIRPILEVDFGIVFAPIEIASKFSHEAWGQSKDTFGFHGFFNLPRVYASNPAYLLANIPDKIILKRLPELLWGALLIENSQKNIFDIELARRISSIHHILTI